jgi:hypothetical protein
MNTFADVDIVHCGDSSVLAIQLYSHLRSTMKESHFHTGKWNPTLSSTWIKISNGDMTAQGDRSNGYVVGTIPMHYPFVYSFEIENEVDGHQTSIGVISAQDAIKESGNTDLWRKGWVCAISYGDYYAKSVIVALKGTKFSCKSGDTVRFTVDMCSKTLYCEKLNSESPLVAFVTCADIPDVVYPAVQMNSGKITARFLPRTNLVSSMLQKIRKAPERSV